MTAASASLCLIALAHVIAALSQGPRFVTRKQVRPLLDGEKARGAKDVVEVADTCQVRLPARRGGAEAASFGFDRAYKMANPGRQMFAEVVQPLLERFVRVWLLLVAFCRH